MPLREDTDPDKKTADSWSDCAYPAGTFTYGQWAGFRAITKAEILSTIVGNTVTETASGGSTSSQHSTLCWRFATDPRWLAAIEELIDPKNLASSARLAERRAAWDRGTGNTAWAARGPFKWIPRGAQ